MGDSGMAKTDAPPADPVEAPAAAAIEPLVPALLRAEYLSEQPRTYRWPSGPQTAELGDVCEMTEIPADGCWAETSKPVTRKPDNHRDNSPGEPDWENIATSLAEREEILKRLGLEEEEA